MTLATRPEISVRAAVAADAHTLAALSIQVWLSTYTEGVSDLLARHVMSEFTPQKFLALAEAPDVSLQVALADERLIGYAFVRYGVRQPLVPGADSELCTLYVQEPFTRSGVGSALLHAASADNGKLWLTVNAQNLRARRFYEKHGFVVKGTSWFVLGAGRHENLVLGR
ncbi:GNAT family N-acetyltransferase [Variovorax boronicumulans]|uniref:GNAT family N-acetyltransferase n=1 Tax=Variovorax boronicumulans TaxID=436515 RepID=UPI003396BC63